MNRALAALAACFLFGVALNGCSNTNSGPAPESTSAGRAPASSGSPSASAGQTPNPSSEAPTKDEEQKASMAGGDKSAPFAGGGQSAPFAGGGQDEKDPEVDKLVAAAEKVEKELKGKPADGALKKKVGEAYYQAGHTMMMSPKLGFKTKYRGALKHFRTALKYDPKHPKATEEKKTIEDIYVSMGRPIPD